MRRIRFQDPAGSVRNGLLVNKNVRFGNHEYSKNEVNILPPVEPTKIVCVGYNYLDHSEEVDHKPPEAPSLFFKPPHTVSGHGATITLPAGKDRIEPEAELGVVIGQQCKNVSEDSAFDVIEGYTCVNDLSNRDDQRGHGDTGERDIVRGKAFDNAAPVGPVIATPDEVPTTASIELRVNRELQQSSTIDKMIFPPAKLVSEITKYLTLMPGDVISTGTPSGMESLQNGDKMEVCIEGIGTLENTVDIPES